MIIIDKMSYYIIKCKIYIGIKKKLVYNNNNIKKYIN